LLGLGRRCVVLDGVGWEGGKGGEIWIDGWEGGGMAVVVVVVVAVVCLRSLPIRCLRSLSPFLPPD
jgi:hypothetical protein